MVLSVVVRDDEKQIDPFTGLQPKFTFLGA